MRADTLTKKLDENSGRFSSDPNDLQSREQEATGEQASFYSGSQLGSDRGRQEAGLGRGQSDIDNKVLQNKESQGNFVKKIDPPVMQGGKPAKLWQLLASKKLRGKSSLLTVIVLLFGGGGFLSALLAPSAAIIQLKEVFTESLNDQLKAMDTRSASIMKAKFKATTTGSCGVIKIKCQFAEMTEKQAQTFNERDKRFRVHLTDVRNGSGKISKISFLDDGKPPLDITNANQFGDTLKSNPAFLAAWGNVYSVAYESVSDPKARHVIRDKLRATKNMVLHGKNDEERRKNLNQMVIAGDSPDIKNLVKHTDKDGNNTYTDENGRTYSQADYDEIEKRGSKIDTITKAGGQNGILANANKILGVNAVAEYVCTTNNVLRSVSAMAKLIKKQQAIRFALALVLTMSDKIKAGNATEEEVNFAGNTIMTAQPNRQVIDDSKLTNTYSGSVPITEDPEAGNTGLDAPSYRMTAYGDVPELSSRASKFTLTGGSTAVIDAVSMSVATAINAGNPDPREASRKCGYVQNTFVRVGALGLGIVAGAATFGTWQIAGTAASIAFALAQPSLEAAAGDMVAGNVFKDINGIDSVDATYVGTASLLGDISEARGLLPITGEEGKEYLNSNRQTLNAHIQSQKLLARSTPFDINNRYSFLGSMLFAATPTILQSRSSASVAMMNMASIIPTTFATINKTAGAAAAPIKDEYFESCPDQMYKIMNIKAGPFCEVRHYMPQNSLELDPLENAQWMADTGNIDPDSDTGEARDNDAPWNYVKYLAECTNRTVGWGENESENGGDGTNCYSKENEPLNVHFRAYTADLSINGGMREGDTDTSMPNTEKGVIALDPGHSVQDIDDRDATTGAILSDYPNGREVDDMWDIAMKIKTRLEQAGYTVKMLRNSKDERVNYQQRADRAKGSQLAISLHTTPSGGSQVGAQFVGGYRSANGKTLEFKNADTATKSQQYAQAMARARTGEEGSSVDVRNFNFDGRGGDIASGNLPWVQLLSPDTPWIYNEMQPLDGGGGANGISEADKNRYIDGIVAGVEASGLSRNSNSAINASINTRTDNHSTSNPITSLFSTVRRLIGVWS